MFKRGLMVTIFVVANLCLAMFTLAQSEPLPFPSGEEEYQLVEGDIMLPTSVVEGRAVFQAVTWPDGIVPYVFHESVNSTNQNLTIAAMTEWESVSGVTFVPRTSETNYLEIINSGSVGGQPPGNWSYVGVIGGRQYFSMSNWNYHYIIMHELMHALGFWHEQSRPDRDTYISIQWQNIPDASEHNFAIRDGATAVGPYDFASVMHYDSYAFSSNGQRTIVVQPGYEAYQDVMGNLESLTELDIEGVNLLYPDESTPHSGAGDTPAAAFEITMGQYTKIINSKPFVMEDEPIPSACVGTNPVVDSIWFKIPAQSVPVAAYFSAAGYDIVMSAYTYTDDTLTFEGCVDKMYLMGAEEWDLALQANLEYYIQIVGSDGSSGVLIFEASIVENLVNNGSLDWGTTGWTVKSIPSTRRDDKIKTGTTGMAYSRGWIQLKGGTKENSTIKQTYLPNGRPFFAGESYLYGAYLYSPSAKNKVILKVVAKYANGTQTMSKMTGSGLFFDWTFGANLITLTRSDVTSLMVVVNNKSLGGQTKLDNLILIPYGAGRSTSRFATDWGASAASVKPLPTNGEVFRGGN
jgi:hypothetical protein